MRMFTYAPMSIGTASCSASQFHCQPEASAVASVLVRLTSAPAGEVTWHLTGEVLRELPATVEADPVADSPQERLFRVLLPRPQPQRSTSSAMEQALPAELALSLATLPEATGQLGLLEVHSPTSRVAIRTTDLRPLPFRPTRNRLPPRKNSIGRKLARKSLARPLLLRFWQPGPGLRSTSEPAKPIRSEPGSRRSVFVPISPWMARASTKPD